MLGFWEEWQQKVFVHCFGFQQFQNFNFDFGGGNLPHLGASRENPPRSQYVFQSCNGIQKRLLTVLVLIGVIKSLIGQLRKVVKSLEMGL